MLAFGFSMAGSLFLIFKFILMDFFKCLCSFLNRFLNTLVGVLILDGLQLIFFIVSMVWICVSSRFHNTLICEPVLSTVCMEPTPFLLLAEEAGGVQESG